jgi:hypothetical protein
MRSRSAAAFASSLVVILVVAGVVVRHRGAVRRSIREHGGEPSSRQVDELLDERVAHLRGASDDVAIDT